MNYLHELLQLNKHALQCAHDQAHIDFVKPFIIEKIEGKFTINQILKKVNASFDTKICLFVKHYYGNDLEFCTISGGALEIDYRISYNHAANEFWLSHYYAKRCFEDDRKKDNSFVFIIAQDKAHLTTPTTKTIDYSKRYTKKEVDRAFSWRNVPEIDKSGYIVTYKQQELKRRARALRNERNKAAFLAVDYTANITELEKLIATRKQELVEMLLNVNSYEDSRTFEKAIDGYSSGFTWILYDFELYKNRLLSKWYSSPAAADNAYTKLKTILTGGIEK